MAMPYGERRALVSVLEEMSELSYDQLKAAVSDKLRRQNDSGWVAFDKLIDEAYEMNVIEYGNGGYRLRSVSPTKVEKTA